MRLIKYSVFTLLSVLVIASIFIVIFLYSGKLVSVFWLLTGILIAIVLFIRTIIQFFSGRNRLKTAFICVNVLLAVMLLLLISGMNFIIINEIGDYSAKEKFTLVTMRGGFNVKDVETLTNGYPVIEHGHIIFKYTPKAKDEVENIIASMDELHLLEQQIFGESLPKAEKLEVIVLPSIAEYRKLLTLAGPNEYGSYLNSKKTAVLYQERADGNGQEYFMKNVFSHEYGHYLFDLFAMERTLERQETPIWYQEGLSEYISSEITGYSRAAASPDAKLTLHDLSTTWQWNHTSPGIDPYALAAYAMEFIAATSESDQIFSAILTEQQAGGSFDTAFYKITGIAVEELLSYSEEIEKEIDDIWRRWYSEKEYGAAGQAYEKLIQQLPRHRMLLHQYALMLEEESRFDEAVEVRRKLVKVERKNPVNFISLSYLLTVIDSEEAVKQANTALQLAGRDELAFYTQWLDEVTAYDLLLRQGKLVEAYEVLANSEQLELYPTIIKNVKEKYTN
ncbi:hypothetical protein DV702_05560 [Sporosarcina sp. PTS2304]|uniref:collagenase n=1 Tax=Sporosarcina sp. PTS2304 TaxID=2283194 RepID=UPI000E0CD6EF|nr:collagenase [Sporosarcina sp. PTS2304]AXH99253.1 hypothetical protein DV702_05560 [Sporosarcina sp. PTS2304]